MPDELATAIGWHEEPPAWSEVFATADDEQVWSDLDHPEWGEFKLGKTSPLVASSGEAAMLASYGAAAGSVADLTADGTIEEAVAAADDMGGVDILINALGEHLWLAKPFERSTPADWDALYRVNLLATMRASHAALPGMRRKGWGRIVNFSSVEGIRAMPNAAPYTAFKGAIDSFTRSLGVEVARHGVRVNAVAVDKTRSHQVGFYRMGEEWEAHVREWVPAARYGEPDDVAAVACFLASGAADWIVGQTIPADGGTLAAGGWYPTPTRWTNSPLLVQWFEEPGAGDDRPPMLR